jgi:hypothetical protein
MRRDTLGQSRDRILLGGELDREVSHPVYPVPD